MEQRVVDRESAENALAELLSLREAPPVDAWRAWSAALDDEPVVRAFVDVVDGRVLPRRALAEAWFARRAARVEHGHARLVELLREVTADDPWLHDYARRHLIHHATQALDDDAVVHLLTNPEYLRARADAGEIHDLAEQAREWYELRGVADWSEPSARFREVEGLPQRSFAKRIAQLLREHAPVIGTHAGAGDRAIDLIVGGLMDTGFTRDEVASAMPGVLERPLLRLAGRALPEDDDGWARARASELLAEPVQVETAGEWFVVRTRRGQVVATRSDERVVVLTRPEDVVTALAVSSRDGERHVPIALGHRDGRVTIHEGLRDDGSPNQAGWQRARGYHTGEVVGVAWITDSVFATWDDSGELTVRDVAKGALEGWHLGARVTAFGSGDDALAVGTDDGVIAVLRGTAGDGAPVAFLDTRPGRAPIEPRPLGAPSVGTPTSTPWARATAHRSAIVGAAVCGDVVVTAERDGDVIVHRIADGERVDAWRDHGTAALVGMSDHQLNSLATWDDAGAVTLRTVARDGFSEAQTSFPAVGPSTHVRLDMSVGILSVIGRRVFKADIPSARLDAGTPIALHDADILDAAWLARDQVLATVSHDNSLRVWNPDGEQLARFGPPTEASPAIALAGRHVVTRRGRVFVIHHAERVEQELARVRSVEATHWDVAPDGRWLTAIGNGRWVLHDLEHAIESSARATKKGEPTTGWSHRVDGAIGCAFSPDAAVVVSWTRDGEIIARDADSGHELERWRHDVCGVVDVVPGPMVSPWRGLALGEDGRLRGIESGVPDVAETFDARGPAIRGIVPTGEETVVWTRRSFGPLDDAGRHTVDAEIVAFWVADRQMPVAVARLADGRLAVAPHTSTSPLLLRPRGARVVDVVSPTPSTLATLQSDGRLTLWDLADGSEISIAVVPAPAAGLVSSVKGALLNVVDAAGGLSSFSVALDERSREDTARPRIAVLASPVETSLAHQYAAMLRGQGADASVSAPDGRTTAIHALVDGASLRTTNFAQQLLHHARDLTGPEFFVLLLDESGDAAWRELTERYGLTTATRTIGAGVHDRHALRELQRAAVDLAWGSRRLG